MSPPFTLFHLDRCFYCVRVIKAARKLGIELELVEINEEPWARELLLERRGRATVPVLKIPTADGDILMPESLDIVAYLEQYASRN